MAVRNQPHTNSSGDPHLETNHHKKMVGGVAQLVDCLPRKLEALSSNPNAKERKEEKDLSDSHSHPRPANYPFFQKEG
jgi:hypothetical protein